MFKNYTDKTVKWANSNKRTSTLILVSLITATFFVFSLRFNGPAYFADETGYLTKAAALSGSVTDTASSYFSGYPIIMSPIFFLTDNAIWAWRGVLLVNAFLWGGSFLLLTVLLAKTMPKIKFHSILLAVLGSALYPSWIVMSGYAFSTSVFVFMAMLILVLLQHLTTKKPNLLLGGLLGLLLGYLFWIHAFGIVLVVVANAYLIIRGALYKRYKIPVTVLIGTAFMVATYVLFVHGLINSYMTVSTQAQFDHYSGALKHLDSVSPLITKRFWIFFLGSMAGQIAYVLVASFGVVGYVIFGVKIPWAKKIGWQKNLMRVMNDKERTITILVILTLAGIIVLRSLLFAVSRGISNDNAPAESHWIYGRYLDLYVLPLIALGLLEGKKQYRPTTVAFFALLAGVFVAIVARSINTTSYFNTLMTTSLWPIAIHPNTDYILWFLFGSIVIYLVGSAVKIFGKSAFLVTLPLLVISVGYQSQYHSKILAEGSKSSPITKILKQVYSKDSCIAFEYNKDASIVDSYENGRLRLIAYENFTHEMKRMSLEDWQENCEGPFITPVVYDESKLLGARYVAREEISGLFVIMKQDDVNKLTDDLSQEPGLYINKGSQACVIDGCFVEYAQELSDSKFTRVGVYSDKVLSSKGYAGLLAYGPYAKVKPGHYVLNFDVDVEGHEEGLPSLRVTDFKEVPTVYLEDKLKPNGEYMLDIGERIDTLQVVIETNKGNFVSLRSYSLSLVQ